jgi:hypothetical protein
MNPSLPYLVPFSLPLTATFILRKHHLEEIKALAYWERKTIKEVMDEALSSYLKGKRPSTLEK